VPSRKTGKSWDWSPEAVNADIDRLIERRSKERDDANHASKAWAESARKYNMRAARERRQAWIAFHENMIALHARLAGEHSAKAVALAAQEGEVMPS
jgi:hypothetical protein